MQYLISEIFVSFYTFLSPALGKYIASLKSLCTRHQYRHKITEFTMKFLPHHPLWEMGACSDGFKMEWFHQRSFLKKHSLAHLPCGCQIKCLWSYVANQITETWFPFKNLLWRHMWALSITADRYSSLTGE